MRILKGPTDVETEEAFKDLTGEEIFQLIRNFEIDEKFFQLSVDRNLFSGLSQEEILIKAAEGGSYYYVQKAHIQLIKNRNDHIRAVLNDAICKASKYGHLQIVKYLINFGADKYLGLMFNRFSVLEFAMNNGGSFNSMVEDRTTGKVHSALWYYLENLNRDIVEYSKRQGAV